MIKNKIQFPAFTGIKCKMMPFIQGDSSSLPDIYGPYFSIIEKSYLEKGEIGMLTIDESFVEAGKSQRGYNATGAKRNVHIEVGHCKLGNRWGGGNGWNGRANVLLEDTTRVLLGNNIDDSCRVWDTKELAYTEDGCLSMYLDRYPENTGYLLKAGELAEISIFTPHECIGLQEAAFRQFFRIVGKGVKGREDYFTINHKML